MPPRIPNMSPTLRYHIRIVKSATAHPGRGQWVHSAIPCRRRPNRRPCSGHVHYLCTDLPDQIRWRCPECGDGGVMSHWRKSPLDLSYPTSYAQTDDPWLEIFVDPKEYRALVKIEVFDEDTERVVYGAEMEEGRVRLFGSETDLCALAEYVAGEVFHASSATQRQRLDALYDKLDRVV